MSAGVPDRPRLGRFVRWYESRDKLILRRGIELHVVEGPPKELALELLELLDGRSVTQIALSSRSGFAILQTLSDFGAKGLLERGDAATSPAVPRDGPRLVGAHFAVTGDESFATELATALAEAGASARVTRRVETEPAETLVVCRFGPDLSAFEELNRVAFELDVPWLPVFPMAGELVIGPRCDRSVCFSCFELRWLAIRTMVELESAFFERLRRGAWREDEALTRAWLPWLVGSICASIPRIDGLSGGETESVVGVNSAHSRRRNVAIVDMSSGDLSWHPIVAHGLCPVCGRSRPKSVVDIDSWRDHPLSISELRAKLEGLADERLGVVSVEPTPTERLPARAGLPHLVLTRFSFPRPAEVLGRQTNFTHGSDPDPEKASTIALVEAIERYVGLTPPIVDIVAPYSQLGSTAILPTELPLFSDAQYDRPGFPYVRFDPNQPMRWISGFSFRSGRNKLVPAAAVYYGEDDPLLTETSSGVAAHSARSAALVGALAELIERDSFFIHWLNRLSPPLVEVDSSEDRYVLMLAGYVRSKGWDLRVGELTTDLGVPAYLAMGIREDGHGHPLLLGAGASMSAALGLRKALKELYSAVVCQPASWIPPELLKPEEVKRAKQHIDFYASLDNLDRARFLFSSSEARPPPEPSEAPESLFELVDHVQDRGHSVYGVELTAPELAGRSLYVVRAIVPGLQPLAFGPHATRLGGHRVFEAPVRMGVRAAPLTESQLNFDPHCFP
ncbi:MAG: TOMM precursor leader peptide-binding protein [Deltaproteobacteria bacterium]|nr:TOMM precursor leader peptide-binding protein [Deltaproteobacteria bacterium]